MLLLVFLMFSGCLGSANPIDKVILDREVTIDQFLEINGLSYEGADQADDRNNDGNNDLFAWDLDQDGQNDIVVDINEEIEVGEHGTVTYGFNRIYVVYYDRKYMSIGEVGKNSGKVISIHNVPIQ